MSEILGEFRKELPGILNWAIEGFQDYQENGLIIPKVVTDATSEYQTDSDAIQAFIDEECDTGSGHTVKGKTMYQVFRDWAKRNNELPLNRRRFDERLKEKGYRLLPGTGNLRYWHGISTTEPDYESQLRCY
jgi:putative DNA primase/helicase